METLKPKNTDHYIAAFPKEVREILERMRATIKKIAPSAEETISYGMPAFKLNGKALVYYAAYNNHIGFYALPSGNESFKNELSKYKTGKGSIQFPLKEEMPWKLIEDIVKFRMKEIQTKTENKKL